MIRQLTDSLQRSREAFLLALPRLLVNPQVAGWWTAYHGEQCLGVSQTPHELLREMQRRGLRENSCYLGVIRPHEPESEEVHPRPAHHFEDDESAS